VAARKAGIGYLPERTAGDRDSGNSRDLCGSDASGNPADSRDDAFVGSNSDGGSYLPHTDHSANGDKNADHIRNRDEHSHAYRYSNQYANPNRDSHTDKYRNSNEYSYTDEYPDNYKYPYDYSNTD
jgi:hypothetical protein